MKNFLFYSIVLFQCFLFGDDSRLGELDRFVEAMRAQEKVPGVSIAVVKGDQILLVKGYGVLQKGQQAKIDQNTIFQLCSVSKTFASAGLGVQVDRGFLEWDEEVIQHLPEFALKEAYPTRFVTARDLLAHRTGLPAFQGGLLGRLGFSNEEILYRIRFITPQTSFRNEAFYSNICFFAAGQLLERISGKSWAETIKKDLLVPLEMSRTSFVPKGLQQSNVAVAHATIDGQVQVIPWNDQDFLAAGGVVSTAADMAHWMIMQVNRGVFKGRQILKPETVQAMHAPSMVSKLSFAEMPPIDENSTFCYGLGWGSYHYQKQLIIEKGGALEGMRSIVTLIPELKLGIAVFANLNLTALPELIRAKFLQLYVGDGKNLITEIAKKEKELEDLMKLPERPRDALPLTHPLTRYEGVFTNELYGDFIISKQGDGLAMKAGRSDWTGTMVHWGNDTFLIKWPLINMGSEFVTFTLDPKGQAMGFQTETLGEFTRVPPKSPSDEKTP